MLSSTGLKVGEDFFLCFSPERVDPVILFQTRNILKWSAEKYTGLQNLVPSSIPRPGERRAGRSTQAEMVKLLENTFRMINISLVNELAMMCERMSINIWEVTDAAATKPLVLCRFHFRPRAGRALHSDRSVLPFLKSKQAGIEARFIELAGTSMARCRILWSRRCRTR